MENTNELKELFVLLNKINDKALDDDKFNNLLSNIFDENIEELIYRLKKVLEKENNL